MEVEPWGKLEQPKFNGCFLWEKHARTEKEQAVQWKI
jgi:hypothetical protein